MSIAFRQRLLSGDRLYGTMLTLPNGAIAEILGDVGFDWIFVDAEHGPIEAGELQLILQTIGRRVPCLVRVPTTDSVRSSGRSIWELRGLSFRRSTQRRRRLRSSRSPVTLRSGHAEWGSRGRRGTVWSLLRMWRTPISDPP